ncbi:hypothetical protein PPYR_07364 [Photinus pyralis]|uniref:Uncharacterized protein n=3 Tax=Photinus pyralis TaxID=7054 RepID=A0A1Y1MAH7_PHOPY|nr:uncharacterized protein LOC116168331 isoform X2 [Photinus pyralis]XP_031339965.1 uncharacterized protein LOC116168331 isoform X2 [Photinus pyralis]KAB0799484.1 hypothetical protein PPYR_07364 [Photinus pyralis]
MVLVSTFQINAAAVKKSIDDSKENKLVKDTSKSGSKKEVPAIIAFEIVDEPEQNATGKSNPKRTIDSSLGYGYHGHSNSYGLQHSQPGKKFVIYKYSQEDITPSAQDSTSVQYSDIQKSIGYKLQTVASHLDSKLPLTGKAPASTYIPQQPVTQYYNPKNTLYTTYDQHGLGGVSNQIPYANAGRSNLVPVIILRVYSNQLENPGTALHTNLPQSSPYSDLNNINLQAYLQNYVQQYLQSQQQSYQPVYNQQHYQQTYSYVPNYQTHSNPSTYANYPSQRHTQIYASPSHPQTTGLSTYKSVSYPTYVAPQPGYANNEPNDVQYVYDNNVQPQYSYVYQNPQQQEYYQSNSQQYESNEDYSSSGSYLPPEEAQSSTKTPYNYHAHLARESVKTKRSKLEKSVSQEKKT